MQGNIVWVLSKQYSWIYDFSCEEKLVAPLIAHLEDGAAILRFE
jgi:hypothetical protein